MKIIKENCYEIIVDELEKKILSGEMPCGMKLPSEQNLANQFGVSRNVARESLKTLKERQLVIQRNGDGTYVSKPDSTNVAKVLNRLVRLEGMDFHDIFEMRLILEPYACKIATTTITHEQILALENEVQRMENSENEPLERAQADLRFHQLLIEFVGNPFMECIYKSIMELASPVLEDDLRSTKEGHFKGVDYHRQILKVIDSGDADKAELVMRKHLEDSKARLEKKYPRKEI